MFPSITIGIKYLNEKGLLTKSIKHRILLAQLGIITIEGFEASTKLPIAFVFGDTLPSYMRIFLMQDSTKTTPVDLDSLVTILDTNINLPGFEDALRSFSSHAIVLLQDADNDDTDTTMADATASADNAHDSASLYIDANKCNEATMQASPLPSIITLETSPASNLEKKQVWSGSAGDSFSSNLVTFTTVSDEYTMQCHKGPYKPKGSLAYDFTNDGLMEVESYHPIHIPVASGLEAVKEGTLHCELSKHHVAKPRYVSAPSTTIIDSPAYIHVPSQSDGTIGIGDTVTTMTTTSTTTATTPNPTKTSTSNEEKFKLTPLSPVQPNPTLIPKPSSCSKSMYQSETPIPDISAIKTLKKLGYVTNDNTIYFTGDALLPERNFATIEELRRNLCAYGVRGDSSLLEPSERDDLEFWVRCAIVRSVDLFRSSYDYLQTTPNRVQTRLKLLGFRRLTSGDYQHLSINGGKSVVMELLLQYLSRLGLPECCYNQVKLRPGELLGLEMYLTFMKVDTLYVYSLQQLSLAI
jgi:hypothetical protein